MRAITGARTEQILRQAREIAERTAGHNQVPGGSIVVTGGSSKLRGIEDVAAAVFGRPARRGDILPSDGFPPIADPSSTTSVGLVRYCASRGAWAATPPAENGGDRPERPENARRGWMPVRASQHQDEPVAQQVNRRAGTIETRTVETRAWGRLMREWMREFIPARTDA